VSLVDTHLLLFSFSIISRGPDCLMNGVLIEDLNDVIGFAGGIRGSVGLVAYFPSNFE